ncbi:hypothetical protein O181_076764 [Austropuccinia psidii MF-1]|uniref:alpha-galactosidase n=1 Tax=Austropuccinia psidii MF-1 TaxID=1389203 RepID=A0A9Q3FDM9_9BASI|nr:hypothetical protein [Austropuccinia psidii MF-1]
MLQAKNLVIVPLMAVVLIAIVDYQYLINGFDLRITKPHQQRQGYHQIKHRQLTFSTKETLKAQANQVTYLGWSSWSLQAFKGPGYGFYWLNEDHVKAQADVIFKEFSQFGFNRINLDSGWQGKFLDQYGRPILNLSSFPSGIDKLQSFLAEKNLKLGLYYLPGIDARAVVNQSRVMDTHYTANQIIQCPIDPKQNSSANSNCKRPLANAFQAGYPLNYSHPGSQMYINSLVDGLYSWNVSFVKLDGNVPGSSFLVTESTPCDTRADLRAWRRAIEERHEAKWKKVGREKIWLAASWAIPVSQRNNMDATSDSWRIEQDVEEYGTRMTTFDRVIRNVRKSAGWTCIEKNRGWKGLIDLDSILVSDMSYEESQSMVTMWAMLGSPFYLGDDLTRLPSARKALLQNPEILQIQRVAAGNPARLDRFNVTRYNQKQAVIYQTTSFEDCEKSTWKRRMILESLQLKSLPDLQQCPTTRESIESNLDLEKRATNITSRQTDEWFTQFWTLEGDNGVIYVAVVNAGLQNNDDKPIDIAFNLDQIERLQKLKQAGIITDEDYLVRDVWQRENFGIVDFKGMLQFKLKVHGCILLKFTPIRQIKSYKQH